MATKKKPEPKLSRSGARERLLQVTSDILSERDTLDVPISEISGRSGLNHGLVKYYFGSKEGLLLALLEYIAADAIHALESLVAKDMPPLKKIERHIEGIIGTYATYPYLNRLIAMLQSGSRDNAEELSRIFIVPLKTNQTRLIEEGKAHGDIKKELDPNLFYISVVGCCEFLFQSRNTLALTSGVHSFDALQRKYTDHVISLLLDGMRFRKPATKRASASSGGSSRTPGATRHASR